MSFSSSIVSGSVRENGREKDIDDDYDASLMGMEKKIACDFRKKPYSVISSVHRCGLFLHVIYYVIGVFTAKLNLPPRTLRILRRLTIWLRGL